MEVNARRVARPLRRLDVPNKTDAYSKQFAEFLYDEGPHQLIDIAEHFKMGESWTGDILQNMKLDGQVKNFRRGRYSYWMLTNP